MISVDKSTSEPLYLQIYESARQTIASGGFQPGDRLPSIRALMDDLGVSRNTVMNAYNLLCAEGYATGVQGSGYVVSDMSADALLETPPAHSAFHTPIEREEPDERAYDFDFYYGNLLADSFPIEDWRRITGDVLYSPKVEGLTSYGRKRGEMGLRREIARYLGQARGVRCVPEQVVLTSGTQQSVNAVLSLFEPAKHTFGMEDPGYDGVRVVVEGMGFSTVPLRTNAGAEVFLGDVMESGAKLAYVTPSHQMPTGSLMGPGTRADLVRIAADRDMYVLEDDYDSEFRFNVRPVPSLQSVDAWEHVIYLGTFSKILSPALRLSYAVLPPRLLNAYNARYGEWYSTVPWLEQEVLRRFMEEGLWDRHVRRIVSDVRDRHARLMECIDLEFGDAVQVVGDAAGLHVLLKVGNGMRQEELVRTASEHGIRVGSTRRYWMNPTDAPDDTVLLGYSGASIPEIEGGITGLARAWLR